MRNAIVVILVASTAGFLWWYYNGPDRRTGEDAVVAQVEMTAEEASSDQTSNEEVETVAEAEAQEAADEAEIIAMEEETIVAEEATEEPSGMTAEEEEVSVATVLTTRVDEIVSAYENAPWVHEGKTGPVLYVITFRTCSTCLAFKEAELHELEEAGVDVRWIVYTRRDREGRERSTAEERAVQAELWLTRDYDLFKEWYAVDPDTFYVTTQLPVWAEAEGEDHRLQLVEDARALVDNLSDLYAENDVDLYIPSLLWQQDGQWQTYVGYEEASFAPVREALVEGH